jgi:hypothetical protein
MLTRSLNRENSKKTKYILSPCFLLRIKYNKVIKRYQAVSMFKVILTLFLVWRLLESGVIKQNQQKSVKGWISSDIGNRCLFPTRKTFRKTFRKMESGVIQQNQ